MNTNQKAIQISKSIIDRWIDRVTLGEAIKTVETEYNCTIDTASPMHIWKYFDIPRFVHVAYSKDSNESFVVVSSESELSNLSNL